MTFELFYQAYYLELLRRLRSCGLSASDAEDLTSQVFLYCYEHWSQYDPQKASQRSWLYLIAGSRLKNFWRDRRVNVDLDELAEYLPDGDSTVEQAQMLDEWRDALAAALEQLAPRSRQIVILRYFKGLNANEIALRLGMTPGAVRTQLSRSLDKLQTLLADYCE